MDDRSQLSFQVSNWLLRFRWLFVSVPALAFALFELEEHVFPSPLIHPSLVRELVVFGLASPLVAGIALSVLSNTHNQVLRAYQRLDRERALGQQLSQIQNWNDLAHCLVRFPHTFIPVVGVALYVNDVQQARFYLAAHWPAAGDQALDRSERLLLHGFCRVCEGADSPTLCTQPHGSSVIDLDAATRHHRYALCLQQGGRPVALLFLYLPSREQLSPAQIDILNSTAPMMSLAIENASPQRFAAVRAQAASAERRQIARELHDSLGQSLGYLHLKLDQLTYDDTLAGIEAVRDELESMRGVANQAYEQVRATLDQLHLASSGDLATDLMADARSISARAGLQAQLHTEGRSRPLVPHVRQQVRYLFREALTNVEKHAGACQIHLHVDWTEDALVIDLADDGRGFDADHPQVNGRYGLAMMRERAEEIDGLLTLTSRPGAGTRVTLRLPLHGRRGVLSTGQALAKHERDFAPQQRTRDSGSTPFQRLPNGRHSSTAGSS